MYMPFEKSCNKLLDVKCITLNSPLIYIYIYIYKENNMYMPFEKSCNKLLDVKFITLNSPLISRTNSVKLINTYSIILKLYKS